MLCAKYKDSTMPTSSHVLPRTCSLRRRRLPLPFLALGSLLASSKTCHGFCTNRDAVPHTTRRTRARLAPTNNSECSNVRFSSKTTDSTQSRGLCLSTDRDGIAENDAAEKISANPSSRNISLTQRVRILFYRTVLSVTSLLITALAIFDSDILSGTGMDGASIIDWTESVLPLTAGMTLLLAPVPNVGRATLNFVGIISIVSALPVASSILETTGSGAVEDIQRVLVALSLMSICAREIFYFGWAYKVEAIVALVTLPLSLVVASDQAVGFSLPMCALAMDVLATGKVFEPCTEDFERSNSEFLADGRSN